MAKGKTAPKGENMKTVRRILHYIRPYTGLVILSLLLSAVTVALTLYIPILTGEGVDYIVGEGNVDFTGLMAVIAAILISILVTAAAQWLMNHINNKITYRIVRDLRVQAFNHLQTLPLSYVDSHSSGDLLSRVITDIDQFSDGLLLGFTQLFSGVITIVGTIVFMLGINPLITLVVVVLSPMSFLIANFIAKKSFTMFKLQSETRGELTGFTNEMLGGIKVVGAFDHQQKAQEEFEEINRRMSGYSLKATFFSSITNPATRFMYSAIYAGVAIAGSFAAIGGALSVGQLSSFLSYTNQYTKPFNDITSVLTEFQNSIVSAARVFALLDEEPEVPEAKDAVVLSHPKGEIRISDVSFSYSPDVPLIEGLNLSVHPGQRIAIVGPTGCGKTTLINLLMRFYDVREGSISVDGHDIRRSYPSVAPAGLRDGPPGHLAALGLHSGQHRLRPPGRHRGGDYRRRQKSPRPQLHYADAAGLRYRHRRRGRQPLPGPEAAALHRPDYALPAADADSRRGDLFDRHDDRNPHPAGL